MYIYSISKVPQHTNSMGIMIQVVGTEIRKIGHWTTYSCKASNHLTDADKTLVGWYWYNTNKEHGFRLEDETILGLKGKKAELFEQLNRIYILDRAFFELVMKKLNRSVWTFEDEIKRRESIRLNTPSDVKYIIYDSDDYGRTIGEPTGTAIVTTTGDPRADKTTAIKRYLAKKTGQPEDEVMGIGFYNSVIFSKYESQRDEHLTDLREKLVAATTAAVWHDV